MANIVANTMVFTIDGKLVTGADGNMFGIIQETVLPPSWQSATKVGGAAQNIAIDSLGNCYITGAFNATATFGSTNLTSADNGDIFVAKLNSLGEWEWAVQAGGLYGDLGVGIVVDSSGNCYITGNVYGNATFGNTNLTGSINHHVVVAKLNASGEWQWATQISGSYSNSGGIALDSSGNCYVTGYFYETVSFGGTNLTSAAGEVNIYVAKLNTSGVWQWAVQGGGTGTVETGNSIATDSSGNCYITGWFSENATFGSTTLTGVAQNIFVAKLNTSGMWQWAVKAGGTANDRGYDIAVDSSGNCYVTGYFSGTAIFGSTSLVTAGSYDIFVAKLNSSGIWQLAAKAGGTIQDYSRAIAVDSSGNCYVTGYFSSGTAIFGSTSLVTAGSSDIFLAKLNYLGEWEWAVKAGGADSDSALAIALDSSGNCYVLGGFTGTVSFGNIQLTDSGSFVAKFG